ncbi:Orn/Lys/Arg decarboxylase family protein [Peptoniphilus sp. ING2-D1G]|nr:Orn/Lys/Arg decarboxylase family protein [Peptoniphilus sp. ING2-D1G]
MNRYIYNGLKNVKDEISFSMPGHKSKEIFDFDYSYDVTETLGSDKLLHPTDVILKSQQEISKAYGVNKSFYIPNGSTGAIQIAMKVLTQPEDRVLIQRNSHIAVYNSLILNDLDPIYINPNLNVENNLFTGIDPDLFENTLKDNKVKAVLVTSPNYFGVCLNLKKLSEITHKYGAYLIVDEAHGAHLKFSRYEDFSAVNYADAIIHSTHKTLPSLTQSAILHFNVDVDTKKVLKAMKLFLTTSPSYLLMLSSEYGVNYMLERGKEILDRNLEYIDNLFRDVEGIKIFTGDEIDKTIGCVDRTKILFSIKGRMGYNIVKELILRYNIRLEMGDLYYALALSSVCNDYEDFIRLRDAMRDIEKSDKGIYKRHISIEIPKKIEKIRESYFREHSYVDLKNSIGRISGDFIYAYPPGTPIIVPGELFTKDVVETVEECLSAGLDVSGIEENQVEVLK